MNKISIRQAIKTKRLYFDGGTGTVLQSMGLEKGHAPELWSIEQPEKILSLHKQYLEAGCNIIKTNTFGVNCEKYDNYEELIKASVAIAQKAVSECGDGYVAFDIGPTGRLLKPLGDLDFEDAVEIFAKNIRVARELGCDLILIETMNDSYETKAAVLAAKENCDLPVFVTNAYGEDDKLMTGATPEAMVALLEGMGVDALGLNCSCGPDKMVNIVERLVNASSIPVIVNPNAGLPIVINGRTVFNIRPEKFAEYMITLANKGGCILGGCCGTTPEHIKQMKLKTQNIEYSYPTKKDLTVISSYTHAVQIGTCPILIGERINPTGKPKLKDALREGDMSYVLSEAVKQADKGVDILDVNVGVPGLNEPELIATTVSSIQAVLSTPLQIDSSNPVAIERAARIYNGKPLINSVNGKKESMDAIFPIAKKYSGAIIALTMDENGIPATAEERLAIALNIISVAKQYGIDKKDIIVDPLALTVSADTKNALTTLKSIKLLHENGIKTSLGVSNVSFGLPERDRINSTFFANALSAGLDCAIMNPFSIPMMDVYYAFMALNDMDANCEKYVAYACENATAAKVESAQTFDLIYCISKGLSDEAINATEKLLSEVLPLDVISNHVIPALDKVGKAFEEKKIFLPQLLASAQCACAVFDKIKSLIPAKDSQSGKKIILATVEGDIHDIGKNIVKVMLESYGFEVIDLGRDVAPDVVLDAVCRNNCKLVGLSALMTTTVPSMEKTIELLHSKFSDVKVVVGGAVLTQDYADSINADFYAKDAMDTVRFAEEFYKE